MCCCKILNDVSAFRIRLINVFHIQNNQPLDCLRVHGRELAGIYFLHISKNGHVNIAHASFSDCAIPYFPCLVRPPNPPCWSVFIGLSVIGVLINLAWLIIDRIMLIYYSA